MVSIPLDSDIVTQPLLRTEIVLLSVLEFEQFHMLVCDAMRTHLSNANLGYWFSWEPVHMDHQQFCTVDDL